MRVPLSWLGEFVELPSDLTELVATLDDLGLVVEGVEHVGEGLADVRVARVDEIHPIEGADRIRRVIVEAGDGPLQIVCGAMNFTVGNFVPLAPVGAVLPDNFAIAERKMKGVTSFGMLCSGKELGLGADHSGLLILDDYAGVRPGVSLLSLLGLTPDTVLDISPEGNRPDAWSVKGIARDLAARWGQPFADSVDKSAVTSAPLGELGRIDSPEVCGQLHVIALRGVAVTSSPAYIARRLEMAGMRPVNNVVDASNYVMLERGQPTHPYDARLVEGGRLGVRIARTGESLVTLDGAERTLGTPGRGLGDTGVDCVIVDGRDNVIGLAGVMGGSSSEITDSTTDVLLEVAFFDPMTIARTSKRIGLRSEASHRFERGVDSDDADAVAQRFVDILSLSSPSVRIEQRSVSTGSLPVRTPVSITAAHIERLLGTAIDLATAERLLTGIGFRAETSGPELLLHPPASRLDIREGIPGRADVIEEIARLYSYRRLDRRVPSWSEPGRLSHRQRDRRQLRSIAVGLGWLEAWTATLISDEDFAALHPNTTPLRVTNPLASDESVFRGSMVMGLTRAWARNAERGNGEVALFEIGTVATHPASSSSPRRDRGGVGGSLQVELPEEREMLTAVLCRPGDSAETVVASWHVIAERLALRGTELTRGEAPAGWHPTRFAEARDTTTGALVARLGEVHPSVVRQVTVQQFEEQRIGLLEIDCSVLVDSTVVHRRHVHVTVPSKYPTASFDLALVTPVGVSRYELERRLTGAHELVESVTYFDVYGGSTLPTGTRSLTFNIRLSSSERTLTDSDILEGRTALLAAAATVGAVLR